MSSFQRRAARSVRAHRTTDCGGIGTGLVKHALERCVTAATLIGGRALMVNAVDAEAASFWRRRGFVESKDDPLTLFRSIADIAAALALARDEPT